MIWRQPFIMDPLAFRLKNCMEEGYKDPHNGITFYSYGLKKCIEAGKEAVHWDEKRAAYVSQTGSRRRGVSMAIFCYKTGVYPISLETAMPYGIESGRPPFS